MSSLDLERGNTNELWWGRSGTKTRRDSRGAVAGEPAQYTNVNTRTLSADRGRHRRKIPLRSRHWLCEGPRLISQFSQ